jgi:hypothetical protein
MQRDVTTYASVIVNRLVGTIYDTDLNTHRDDSEDLNKAKVQRRGLLFTNEPYAMGVKPGR